MAVPVLLVWRSPPYCTGQCCALGETLAKYLTEDFDFIRLVSHRVGIQTTVCERIVSVGGFRVPPQ